MISIFEVFAIELLSLVQAVDYLKIQGKLSSVNKKIYQEVREIVPVFADDSIKYQDLEKINTYLRNKEQELI